MKFIALIAGFLIALHPAARAQQGAPPPTASFVPLASPANSTPAPVPTLPPEQLAPSSRAGGTTSPYNDAGPTLSSPFSGGPSSPGTGLSGSDASNPQYGTRAGGASTPLLTK